MAHANHHKNRRRKNALINLERQHDALVEHRKKATPLKDDRVQARITRNLAEQEVLHVRIKK